MTSISQLYQAWLVRHLGIHTHTYIRTSHLEAGKICLFFSYQCLSTTFPAWDCKKTKSKTSVHAWSATVYQNKENAPHYTRIKHLITYSSLQIIFQIKCSVYPLPKSECRVLEAWIFPSLQCGLLSKVNSKRQLKFYQNCVAKNSSCAFVISLSDLVRDEQLNCKG